MSLPIAANDTDPTPKQPVVIPDIADVTLELRGLSETLRIPCIELALNAPVTHQTRGTISMHGNPDFWLRVLEANLFNHLQFINFGDGHKDVYTYEEGYNRLEIETGLTADDILGLSQTLGRRDIITPDLLFYNNQKLGPWITYSGLYSVWRRPADLNA